MIERTVLQPPFSKRQTAFEARTIKAIIERSPPEEIRDVPQAIAHNMTITVANDPVTGICTAAAVTAANEFDEAIMETVEDFLELMGENVTYYPAGMMLDVNLDEIELPLRIGEAATRHKITGLISQDAGMLKLAVR